MISHQAMRLFLCLVMRDIISTLTASNNGLIITIIALFVNRLLRKKHLMLRGKDMTNNNQTNNRTNNE
jgi:hypothetical protein